MQHKVINLRASLRISTKSVETILRNYACSNRLITLEIIVTGILYIVLDEDSNYV